MLVDSHCHLNLLEYGADYSNLNDVMSHCAQEKIEHFLCIATELKSFPDMVKIGDQFDHISFSAGVHPNEDEIIPGDYDISLNCLYNNLYKQANNKRVIAIGETGLDYYRTDNTEHNKNSQKQRFEIHIEIAKKLKKPLIIHTREASEDTIAILKSNDAATASGIMHCFTENWQVAKQALDLGFYISISGIVTFKNAAQVQEVAQKVPLDRLLIETDCPYLAPIPHRGKPNYPQYIKHVAMKIAELRSLEFEKIAQCATNNFYSLFKELR